MTFASLAHYLATNYRDLLLHLLQHIGIVAAALLLAVPIGMTAGIAMARLRRGSTRRAGLYLLGLGQTIPSLALLALAVGFLGIGWIPAVVALLLYSILPIAQNCCTGLLDVDPAMTDAARGLGMTESQIVRRVQIPLAAPMIMAGIRTSTIIAISGAALAALVGAGGLGEFVFTGISLYQPEAMLAGAVPTALLGIVADRLLARLERRLARRTGSVGLSPSTTEPVTGALDAA